AADGHHHQNHRLGFHCSTSEGLRITWSFISRASVGLSAGPPRLRSSKEKAETFPTAYFDRPGPITSTLSLVTEAPGLPTVPKPGLGPCPVCPAFLIWAVVESGEGIRPTRRADKSGN